MTREEVINKIEVEEKFLMIAGYNAYNADVAFDKIKKAVKSIALEQEPILDKIRAEIENHCGLAKENHCKYCSYCNSLMGVREILETIDKYKAESEESEDNE